MHMFKDMFLFWYPPKKNLHPLKVSLVNLPHKRGLFSAEAAIEATATTGLNSSLNSVRLIRTLRLLRLKRAVDRPNAKGDLERNSFISRGLLIIPVKKKTGEKYTKTLIF